MMWSRIVALGDSFTEGMSDRIPRTRRYRGWADRLVEHLARQNPELQYANIAIRGRLTHDVVHDQVPAALAMEPDLVFFACGINDLMRSNFDLSSWVQTYELGVRQLRDAGSDVLITAFGNPEGRPGVLPRWVELYRDLNRETVRIARDFDCHLVDFWPRKEFDRDAYWSADRLHLSALGHQVTAELAAEALGHPFPGSSTVTAPDAPVPWAVKRAQDVAWLGMYALPWAVRRARGKSSGDGIEPKRPALAPVR